MKLWNLGLFACCAVALVGCQRAAEPEFVSAREVDELDEPAAQALRGELQARCGTPGQMKSLAGDHGNLEQLRRGAQVYQHNCQQCHGVSGDGQGPAAAYLTPRPRDYRRGIFKFTSTGYGHKPRREDLLRTITRGVAGTSMPSFRRLPKHDLEAVVDYVLALTQRGELEILLAAQAQSGEDITPELASEMAQNVLDRWHQGRGQVVEPATKMPDLTPESIAAGAVAFQKRECFKCHGRDGRGGLAGGIDVGQDAWGQKDPAADLTSGMLHGGQQPLDIYRRIYAGINGTPMPSFKDAFATEPDTVWHLTHYVLHLADERRRGVQFKPEAAKAAAETQPSPDPQSGKPAP